MVRQLKMWVNEGDLKTQPASSKSEGKRFTVLYMLVVFLNFWTDVDVPFTGLTKQ